MRRGKTIDHCFFKKSNDIHGGVPKTLDDIKTEPDLVNFFVDDLFVYKTQLTHKTKFKRILAAKILRFHDEFLELLRMNHMVSTRIQPIIPSIAKLFLFFAETQISMETFHKWQYEVIVGFNERNWLGVDV